MMIFILFFWMFHLQCFMFYFSLKKSVIPANFQDFSRRKCAGVFLWISSHSIYISNHGLVDGVIDLPKDLRDDSANCQRSQMGRRLSETQEDMSRSLNYYRIWYVSFIMVLRHIFHYGSLAGISNRFGFIERTTEWRYTIKDLFTYVFSQRNARPWYGIIDILMSIFWNYKLNPLGFKMWFEKDQPMMLETNHIKRKSNIS